MSEQELKWERFLIREEFFKLYFEQLSLSENLNVNRLTDLYEINRQKVSDTFHFAIIRYKLNPDFDGNSNNYDMLRRESGKVQETSLNDFLIMYPLETQKYDDSINFLSLVFSGMSNINEKQSKLFVKDDENPNYLKNLLNDVKYKKYSKDEKINLNEIINQQDVNLKNLNELRLKHNSIVQKTFSGHLENIPPIKKDKNSHFSLIFFKDSTLYEFTCHDMMLREIKRNVSLTSVYTTILDEILKTGEKNQIIYQNDITIFSEKNELPDEDVNLNSEGSLIIFTISIIFIVNFFITNPENFLFKFSETTKQFFELDHFTGKDYVNNFNSLDQVVDYFSDNIIPFLYNETTYYRKVINLTSKDNSNSNSTNVTSNPNKIKFNPNKYYPLNLNILCGTLVSFKRSLGSSDDIFFKRHGTFDFYRPNFYQNTSDFSLYSFNNSANPIVGGSYNLYIKPYLKKNKINYLKDLIKQLKDPTISFFSYTVLLYNSNIKTAQVYSISFERYSMSQIEIRRYIQNFTPFVKEDNIIIQVYILNIIYLLGLVYVVFIVVRTFSHHIIDLIKSRKYSFEWHDWMDLIVLVISFTSQIMFYRLYLFTGMTFPIQIGDPETFRIWVTYAMDTKDYNNITGLTIFFITIRLIRILYTSFPNFGIVFQTLSLASKEMIAFIFLLISLIFGILMVSYLNFGWYSDNFRYLGDTIINIFMMITCNFDYGSISNENRESKITPYFYIFFMFFYNLVLINVFLLTLRNNYADVKEKDQKFNEAFALMIAEKSLEFQNKLLHFLVCGDPVIEEEKPYNEIKETEKDLINQQDEEEIQKRRERERIISKMPILTKMKINFEKLNIKKLIFGGNAWTREEFDINKKRKYKEIEHNSLISSIEDLEVDYEKEFDQLSDIVTYFLYIGVFIMVISIQLEITISKNCDIANRKIIDYQFGSFSKITRYDQLQYQLIDFVKNAYQIDKNNLKDSSIKYNPLSIPGYVFLQPPYFRLTLRVLNYESNENNYEKSSFPYIIKSSSPELTFDNCGSDIERKKPIQGLNGTDFKYIQAGLSGLDSSPKKCGGYIYLMNVTNPFTQNNSDYSFDNYITSLFSYPVGHIVLDWVITNIHYETFIYVSITLGRSVVGVINYEYYLANIPINLYQHIYDFTRLFYEIIYLLFFIYYGYNLTGSIMKYMKKYLRKDFEKDPEKEKFRNGNIFNKFFRIDIKSRENESIATALLYFLWKLLERSISFAFFLLNSFLDYLKESVYNLLELTTFILTLIGIGMWISIVQLTSTINIKYINSDLPISPILKKPSTYLISEIELLTNYYREYSLVISINLFLYILKAIQFFRFSKSIYNLVKIIDLAKNTILFHLIFISIIYIGFAIWGFSIFGQQIYEFSTIANTAIELWSILAGDANFMAYVQVDSFWTGIFLCTYVFLNTLILFNILNAIVIETYKELKHRQEQNRAENVDKNFLENVFSIIQNKYNIFLQTADEYYRILTKVNEELIISYIKQLEEGLNPQESKISDYNKQNSSINNYITVMTIFSNLITEKINIIEKIALRMLPKDSYLKSFENVDEMKIIDEYKAEEAANPSSKKLPKITKFDDISVWVKMFAYIIYNIHSDQRLDNIDNGKDPNYELFGIESILAYVETNDNTKEKSNVKSNDKNIKIDPKSNLNINNDDQQAISIKNKYENELNKAFEDFCDRRKEAGFFNTKIFKKEKKLRVNKKAGNHVIFYSTYLQYYNFEIPKKNRLYNLDFVINCELHEKNKKYDFSCQSCYDNFILFYNTYILIYDLCVKYFHLPEKLSINEKEIYIGYYLSKIFQDKKNDDEKLTNKHILEYKYNQFTKQLNTILKLDSINNNLQTLSELENKANTQETVIKRNGRGKISKNNQEEDEIVLINDMDKIKNIYRKFVIWNSIYLIMLKKYPYFTKEIKERSVSFKIIEEMKEKFGQDFYFYYYFSKIFDLDYKDSFQDVDIHKGKLDIIKVKQILREYGAKHQTKIENFDLSLRSFYETNDRYLMNDYNIENIENNYPFERYNLCKLIYKPNEFDLLIKIWNSWKIKDKEGETNFDHFYIFFGYSRNFEHRIDSENFLEFFRNDTFKAEHKIKIYEFFNNKQRAELIKNLSFSNQFVKDFIKKMREFRDKNEINDGGQINTVKNFEDLLNYISLIKINYIKYYDLVMGLFDQHFKEVKNEIKTIDNKYKSLFKTIKISAYNTYENIYVFIDFLKLVISKEKFLKLTSIFNSKNTNHNLNEDNEDDNSLNPEKIIENFDLKTEMKRRLDIGNDNQEYNKKQTGDLKQVEDYNENISLAFSLDPMQLIDVIRNIENVNLRELYFLLMLYIYEDIDYSLISTYLERETKFTLLHKYKYYSMYLEDKDAVCKQREKYENEKSYFSYIYNYSKFMKDKVEKFTELREKSLKKLMMETEEHIKLLNT